VTLTHAQMFEAAMFFLFSIGWYWSIAKMIEKRTAVGKSPVFVAVVCIGYLCGICSKIFHWQEGGEFSPLIYLYVWNLAVTMVDLGLVVYFTRRNKHAATIDAEDAPLRLEPEHVVVSFGERSIDTSKIGPCDDDRPEAMAGPRQLSVG